MLGHGWVIKSHNTWVITFPRFWLCWHCTVWASVSNLHPILLHRSGTYKETLYKFLIDVISCPCSKFWFRQTLSLKGVPSVLPAHRVSDINLWFFILFSAWKISWEPAGWPVKLGDWVSRLLLFRGNCQVHAAQEARCRGITDPGTDRLLVTGRWCHIDKNDMINSLVPEQTYLLVSEDNLNIYKLNKFGRQNFQFVFKNRFRYYVSNSIEVSS